jgi:ATP-dependent Lon protease
VTDSEAVRLLPVLPLRNSVLFPHLAMPLVVGRASSVAAVEAAVATEDKTLLLVAQKDATVEEAKLEDLYRIGTQAVVRKMDRSDDMVQIMVQGLERMELLELEQEAPFLRVRARPLSRPDDWDTQTEALHRTILELAGTALEIINPQAQVGLSQLVAQVKEPLHQIYLLSSIMTLDLEKEQALLEADRRADALKLMYEYLSHEVQVLKLRQKIASEAQSEMSREQREYVLRQQLRAIQEELGEKSPEQADIAELRRKVEEAGLPDEVRKETERELKRLERVPSASPDYQVTRTYVELVAELPWTKTTEDILDLERARQILDEDHYDLKDVKQRIVEHLAVLKLNPQANAPILCFVGPPGVGKTSLGQSIARSLGRHFARMSLGGVHDEAELRGHRRTYVGAMPGRIIQAIRRAGVRNPLMMLDEVDKLGRDFRGDPAAALLEILDPAQNKEFRDNYLDLAFDLSKVFFITTANTLDTVPQPLLDRMEILRLAGYSDEEKLQIAHRYLIPRRLEDAGLKPGDVDLPDETLKRIIRRYTREAGVRELERKIGSLCRKVATRLAEGQTETVTVRPLDLAEMLGAESFFAEDARRHLPSGVAAGLAWTQVGGEVLYVEALTLPEGKDLTLTGQLGEVMKESARAAMSYIASRAAELEIDVAVLRGGVHIHVPAGATPKDGPSAGVTMATALVSAYTGYPVPSDTAMTGEITLSGLVLPVGGIKEKVLAAHRAGIRRVIMPKENEKDLQELPDHVREQIQFVLVEQIEDVFAAAIPELASKPAHA